MSTELFKDLMQLNGIVLLLAQDLIQRRVVPTRKTLNAWMNRKDDPFPRPLVLSKGRQQRDKHTGELIERYSGRRVAWKLTDIEEWLSRRPVAGNGNGG